MTRRATDRPQEFAELDRAFDRAISTLATGEEELCLLYSGGVDSSLLAWELRAHPGLLAATLGLPGSADLTAGEEGARRLGLRWRPITVEPSEVRAVARELKDELAGAGRADRSVQTALALAVAGAPRGGLVCGQGADELFLGYAHYRGLSAQEAGQRSELDLEKLVREDWPRTGRIAARLGRRIHAPYLDPTFASAARSVPIELRLPDPTPKAYFRDWAEHRGLPSDLAARPKRALQFGSGVDRVLRRPA